MSCFLNPLILFLGPYLSPNSSTHTFYLSETAQCIRLQEKKRSQNCQSAWNTNNQHEEITFDQAGLTPDTKSSNLPQSISKTYICICKCSEKLIIYIAILILKNSTSWPQLQTLMRESFRLNKVSSKSVQNRSLQLETLNVMSCLCPPAISKPTAAAFWSCTDAGNREWWRKSCIRTQTHLIKSLFTPCSEPFL